ncbi:MAG: enoyl-CoA hydratase/isomerase family protein, partial [Gammaproteobacteria bacterium]|nr:enoyl-CoA hydratase/isomerase family protein [Gammaproteobacteria bacterium]
MDYTSGRSTTTTKRMTVTYKRKGAVAYITLARADAMNAMSRDMYKAVNEAFMQLNEDDEAKVAIFSSSNPDAFCAGVDINDIHKALTEEGLSLDDVAKQCNIFFEEPGHLHKPVIAAINGHCVGEGMVMTLFCDIRIAAYDASFCLPEAKIGVPSINGTIRAVQVANHGAALELLLTGEPRDADWARMAGFVNTVVPNDELMPTAERMAKNIADNGEEAIRIMRQLGEKALEENFADLVEEGRKLRD